MKISENQIFNLMDTNGRRKDVVNAMNIYLKCLEETFNESHTTVWKAFPNATTEFTFYQKAIEASPEVFRQHRGYDQVMKTLTNYSATDTFLSGDKVTLDLKLGNETENFYKNLDKNVEQRSRHYTSNLVKIGFTDDNRQITEVGRVAMSQQQITRDEIEQLLPLDDTNLLYLRQLLKLRVYRDDGSGIFCSPMIVAIYLLLKHPLISRGDFANIIQSLSPYKPINDIDQYLENYFESGQIEDANDIPEDFERPDELDDRILKHYFKNIKTPASVSKYIEFYHRLYSFVVQKNKVTLDSLLNYWNSNRSILNKAFGFGKAIFKTERQNDVESFLEKNENLSFLQDIDNFNREIFRQFQSSKLYDGYREYSDTTIRIYSVTGIFKFRNGLVELAYPEIFTEIFRHIDINQYAFGRINFENMGNENEYFMSNVSIMDILQQEEYIPQILDSLNTFYQTDNVADITNTLTTQRQRDFITFIDSAFPKEHIIEILDLFRDRHNDNRIKELVNPTATVPTIFEYIVGISWYYLSERNFDLLNSFNLTLDADFLPIEHAGGNEGDIVIDYENYVIMLEVTLMNTQAQRRAEWEPVLRHTVNKKAVCLPKDMMTFFIADELDLNTVNIWRAVSRSDLETTDGTNVIVRDVRIMPISIEELEQFLRQCVSVETLFIKAEESYENIDDDANWRENYLRSCLV